MTMKDYIEQFIAQIQQGIQIGSQLPKREAQHTIQNIVIAGLGGSGVGGSILVDVLSPILNVPILLTKDYSLPQFTSKNTLFIACSYSGNTEETLEALDKAMAKGCTIAGITSGGLLEQLLKANNYLYSKIPSGNPPRGSLMYSFSQLFFILEAYGLTTNTSNNLKQACAFLEQELHSIQKETKQLAECIKDKLPVIYVPQGFEGTAIRLRQQINENSKMLCWHAVIPEMNHNELVGWKEQHQDLAVLFFRTTTDYYRVQSRIEYCQSVVESYTTTSFTIWAKGETLLEQTLYLILWGDWLSWYLSEYKSVDAMEIDVINTLKQRLLDLK